MTKVVKTDSAVKYVTEFDAERKLSAWRGDTQRHACAQRARLLKGEFAVARSASPTMTAPPPWPAVAALVVTLVTALARLEPFAASCDTCHTASARGAPAEILRSNVAQVSSRFILFAKNHIPFFIRY